MLLRIFYSKFLNSPPAAIHQFSIPSPHSSKSYHQFFCALDNSLYNSMDILLVQQCPCPSIILTRITNTVGAPDRLAMTAAGIYLHICYSPLPTYIVNNFIIIFTVQTIGAFSASMWSLNIVNTSLSSCDDRRPALITLFSLSSKSQCPLQPSVSFSTRCPTCIFSLLIYPNIST